MIFNSWLLIKHIHIGYKLWVFTPYRVDNENPCFGSWRLSCNYYCNMRRNMNISRARFELNINYANYVSRDRSGRYCEGWRLFIGNEVSACKELRSRSVGGIERQRPRVGGKRRRFYISQFPREKFPGCDADGATVPAITRRLAFRYGRNIYAESNAGRGGARKRE